MKPSSTSKRKKVAPTRSKRKKDFAYVPLTKQLRTLALALEKAFLRVYPVEDLGQRRASTAFAKVPSEFLEHARRAIAGFGKLKNELFPSTFADYFLRHKKRAAIRAQFQKIGAKIESGSRVDWTFELPAADDTSTQKRLATELGVDPLETPIALLRENYPMSELLIFLEQYLPLDLQELMGDLAHTTQEFCPLPLQSLAMLEGFRTTFVSIASIRADFILSDHSLNPIIERAHAQLLRLAETINATVLFHQPHVVVIVENHDDLDFTIDGTNARLTKSQKDTMVAWALLADDAEFSTLKFAKLVGAGVGRVDQVFINRRKALAKLLPRIEYDPKHGVRNIRGLIFSKVPPVARLEKFLEGDLGIDR